MTLHPAISRDPFFMRFRSLARAMDDETAFDMAERLAVQVIDGGGIESHAAARLEAAWLSRQEGKRK